MSRRTVLRSAAALALTVVLVLALALPALAASGGSGSITIKPNGQEGLGGADRFTAYQIFEGTVGKDPNELDNLNWGSGVDASELVVAMKESDLSLGSQTFGTVFGAAWTDWDEYHRGEMNEAEFVAQWLAEQTENNALYADDFARLVAKHTKGGGTSSTLSANDWVISGLADGYYLVKDNYESEPGNDASDGSVSSYILQVLGKETVELKATIPTVEKKVEGQDGYLTGIDNQTIHFTLTGSVAQNIDEYDKYAYKFTDTISKGLTMAEPINDHILNVKLGEHTFTFGTDYTVTYEPGTDGAHVLTVTFEDLKGVCVRDNLTLNKDSNIIVSYIAKLTKDAVVTDAGNPNSVTLTYSNNPYGTGEGETAPDEVKTYTIALQVVKQDTERNPLANVGFKLKNDKSQYAVMAESSDSTYWSITGWSADGTELKTDSNGSFSIHGFDAGTYTLVETSALEGYETMKDVEFVISATVDAGGALTNVQLTRNADHRTDVAFGGNMQNGTGKLTLTNFKSPILPHTGGIGAKVVYLVSTLAVLTGAAIVTVAVRKRGRGRHEQTR